MKNGFYDNVRFFRVISGFMVQFGINGDPAVMAGWRDRPIKDDPVTQSNKRGFITFAMAGPNTRTSQVFINFADNSRLDARAFRRSARSCPGMDVVDKLNAEYGEGAPRGRGPDQSRMQREGNAYLAQDFPAHGLRQEGDDRALTLGSRPANRSSSKGRRQWLNRKTRSRWKPPRARW